MLSLREDGEIGFSANFSTVIGAFRSYLHFLSISIQQVLCFQNQPFKWRIKQDFPNLRGEGQVFA